MSKIVTFDWKCCAKNSIWKQLVDDIYKHKHVCSTATSSPFKPGDNVRINDHGSHWHMKEGEIEQVLDAKNAMVVIKMNYGTVHQKIAMELLEPITPILPTPKCNHEWVEYNSGWTAYDYCSKCGIKRSV